MDTKEHEYFDQPGLPKDWASGSHSCNFVSIRGSKKSDSSRGTVILVALCFVAVLGIMLAGYLALCSRVMSLSNRGFQADLSKQLAEAGIDEALRAFNKNDWSDWSNGSTSVDWTLDTTSKRATATITFPADKFAQGSTAEIKVRVDNYDTHVLGAAWDNSKNYEIGDVVGYSGMWYRCVTPHSNQSPTETGNLAYWVPAPIPWQWGENITYTQYDVVNHEGTWYRCGATTLTSSTEPSPTNTNWVTIPSNVTTWSGSTLYAEYDIVTHNGRNYRCISTNTNRSPPDTTYWSENVNSISLSWSSGTVYTIGALVFNDGSWYSCISNHTSGTTFAGDSARWDSSDWAANTVYSVGDIVYRNGYWYSCDTAHTSGSSFSMWPNWNYAYYSSSTTYSSGCIAYYTTTGAWYRYIYPTSASGLAPTNTTYWTPAAWSSGTDYAIGDRVNYNGCWYSCTVLHTSSTFAADSANWLLADPDTNTFTNQKAPNLVSWQYLMKNHPFNDVCFYSSSGPGTWYRRDVNNTSVTAVPTNTSYWENALSDSWDWNSGDSYNIGDVVYASGSFYRCIRAHSNQTPPNPDYWSSEPPFPTYWDEDTNYSANDLVRYRGAWYRNLTGNNARPGTDDDNWAIAPHIVEAWSSTKIYHVDDLVNSSGSWYRCIQDPDASQAFSDNTYWVHVAGSTSTWSASTAYAANSYVSYGGVWYKCIATTSANAGHSPNNTTYWTPTWSQSAGVTTGAPVVYAEATVSLGDGTTNETALRATIDPAALFPNAIATTGTLTIGGAGTVDSYDSDLGAYATGTHSAVIASNYSASTAITIAGATSIKGYLAAPSSSTSPFAPLYNTAGSIKGASSPPSPSVDLSRVSRSPYIPEFTINRAIQQTLLPGTLPNPLNLGTPGAPTPSIYYDTALGISTRVNINGPVILYANGNLNVLSGDTIYINSTGSLVLYQTNNSSGRIRVEAASSGIINRSPNSTNPDPKKLLIFNDTTSTGTQYYSDTDTPFYGAIYLPNTTATNGLTIADGVTIHGALSAKEITFSGAANLHYDTSLRYATFTGVDQPYTVTDWRELSTAEQATLP